MSWNSTGTADLEGVKLAHDRQSTGRESPGTGRQGAQESILKLNYRHYKKEYYRLLLSRTVNLHELRKCNFNSFFLFFFKQKEEKRGLWRFLITVNCVVVSVDQLQLLFLDFLF